MTSALVIGMMAASLSGCQLIEALLPDGAERLPKEGTCATYEVVATDEQPVTPEILEQTRMIIENRIDATGVADAVVHAELEQAGLVHGLVFAGLAGIDHEDGAWRGTFHAYGTPHQERVYAQMDLTGEGAYDGLSAILFLLDNGTAIDVEGMVFPGELPPVPEAAE